MPYRLVNIDITTILLSATGVGASIIAWMSEHEIMGGWVLFTLGLLQTAKAYAIFTGKKKDKP